MAQQIAVLHDKSLASSFNSRRTDKAMQFAVQRQFAERIVAGNEQLQGCTSESLGTALLEIASIGLSLQPSLGHAYLIPYGRTATVGIGYRGMMHMVYEAGTIRDVQANLVRAGDPVFRVWSDESGRHLQHEEARSGRGDVTHAYCIAHYAAGGHHIEVMDRAELDAVEKAATSRPKGGMVWRGAFVDEMRKKAVVRRGWKWWPKDDGGRLEAAIATMDRVEPVDFEPAEQEVTLSDDQVSELHAALTDRGLEPALADKWLAREASRYGCNEIGNLPARLFDKVKDELVTFAKQRANVA
jgi:recombination protein RecT